VSELTEDSAANTTKSGWLPREPRVLAVPLAATQKAVSLARRASIEDHGPSSFLSDKSIDHVFFAFGFIVWYESCGPHSSHRTQDFTGAWMLHPGQSAMTPGIAGVHNPDDSGEMTSTCAKIHSTVGCMSPERAQKMEDLRTATPLIPVCVKTFIFMDRRASFCRTRRIILLAIASLNMLLLSGVVAFGQPNITGIDPATVSEGGAVAIAGSDFGTKNHPAPAIWDNFEWGNDGDLLTTGEWLHFAHGDAEIDTGRKYAGTRSAYGKLTYEGGWENAWKYNYRYFTPSLTVYVSFMLYWDAADPTSSDGGLKASRINSVEPYGGGPPYLKLAASPQTNWYYAEPGGWGVSSKTVYPFGPGQWHRIEYLVILSDPPGASNGYGNVWIDLKDYRQGWNPWPHVGVTREAGNTNKLDNFMLPHMWPRPPIPYAEVWADDVYVDISQARAEIGDASTWTACTHREIQIPTAWSDTSITVTANQGSFANETKAYLYVVDADGNVNAQGFPISFAQAEEPVGDSDPPRCTRLVPAPGAQDAPVDKVSLHIEDSGDGVDIDSIEMRVNGQPVAVNVTGSPADYTVTYLPGSPFIHGSKVTVTVKAQDVHSPPNLMQEVTYSFTTVPGTPGKPEFVD
jgi:hypothetical protein